MRNGSWPPVICWRFHESLHNLNDPTRFRSWFWAIASNLCRDYHKYRQHRHHLSIERDVDLDFQLADMGSARTVELASRIRTALAALDDERRLVVVLREYHELSYEEIAATVGCSVGAVRWRLHAARQQLRAGLSDLIGWIPATPVSRSIPASLTSHQPYHPALAINQVST